MEPKSQNCFKSRGWLHSRSSNAQGDAIPPSPETTCDLAPSDAPTHRGASRDRPISPLRVPRVKTAFVPTEASSTYTTKDYYRDMQRVREQFQSPTAEPPWHKYDAIELWGDASVRTPSGLLVTSTRTK